MLARRFGPFFGEARIDYKTSPKSKVLHHLLFHFYASDCGGCVNLHVTDFRYNYWEAVLSDHELEDMRDSIGVGDNLAEFVDYMVASIKSDSKVIVETHSESTGGSGHKNAKFVAQRSKGMPFVSIYLNLLDNHAVSDAVANFSWILFKYYDIMKKKVEENHLDGVNLSDLSSSDFESTVESMKAVTALSGKRTVSENEAELPRIIPQKTGLGNRELVPPNPLNTLGETKGDPNEDKSNLIRPATRRRGRGPRGTLLQHVKEEE